MKNRLKEIRMKEYMMSSSEFASYLEVKLSTYSRWEKGDNIPGLELAYTVSEKLSRKIEDIWYK